LSHIGIYFVSCDVLAHGRNSLFEGFIGSDSNSSPSKSILPERLRMSKRRKIVPELTNALTRLWFNLHFVNWNDYSLSTPMLGHREIALLLFETMIPVHPWAGYFCTDHFFWKWVTWKFQEKLDERQLRDTLLEQCSLSFKVKRHWCLAMKRFISHLYNSVSKKKSRFKDLLLNHVFTAIM